MSQEKFKVIIVGGSVSGLTLAHTLQKAGIDYTILEKRHNITPQEGASVGIFPNGARVLDQLGVYDAVEEATAPLGVTHIHYPDNFNFTSDYPKKVLESFGYPVAFLERRKLLEILYDTLPTKDKVRVNKEVSHIEQCISEDGKSVVQVHTVDGDVYDGDLVVGADGVHSRIRREMWRLSSLSGTPGISQNEKNGMSAEYSCVFGISKGVSGLKPGEQILHIYDGQTLVVIPSKEELVFWFLSRKMDRKYQYSDAPRFTLEAAAAQCLRVADAPLDRDVRFSHVWEKQQTFNMVVLEENLFKTWSFGRVVCIGDSIHKMTVNLGQGANCAIEDTAVLSNLLHSCLRGRRDTKPTDAELGAVLRHFNGVHLSRVSHICDMSWLIARVHARDGFIRKVIGRYIMPNLTKRFQHRPFNLIADGATLEFLPLPPRSSYPGWEKYRSSRDRIKFWTVVGYFSLFIGMLKLVSLAYKQ